jgi:hypothetical protein
MAAYPAPKVLDLTEPWATPLLSSVNRTRKTAIALTNGERFMLGTRLGTFFPYDDVSLGVTTFRAGPLPPPLPEDEVTGLSDEWCDAALWNLPLATLVYRTGGAGGALELLRDNTLATSDPTLAQRALAVVKQLDAEWASVAEQGAVDQAPPESWELHEVAGSADTPAVTRGGGRQLVFVWRPVGSE